MGKNKPGLLQKTRHSQSVVVIVACLSGAVLSFYLFYSNLFQTLDTLSIEPAGTVTIRENIVQRRLADRMLWDRLFTDSPVFYGDLIRVAEASSAVLHITGNNIELVENTLIRIDTNRDITHIELRSGQMSIVSAPESTGLLLSIQGSIIETGQDTILSALAGEDGMVLQVLEGSILLSDGNNSSRQLNAGTLIALDADGRQLSGPTAIMTSPLPNARYLKNSPEALEISFAWIKNNLEHTEALRLEIAENQRFTRIAGIVQALDQVIVALPAGIWHYRLMYGDTMLTSGRLTVMDTPEPVLHSPTMNQVFNYRTRQPELRFRWSPVEGATHYIWEVAAQPDFEKTIIARPVWGASLLNSELGPGTWFWRVRPMFPYGFIGASRSSPPGSFHIGQSDELQAPVLRSIIPGNAVSVAPFRNEDILFSWAGNNEAVSYTILICAIQDPDNPVIMQTVRNNFFLYGRSEHILSPQLYYWSVFFTDSEGNQSPHSQPRVFIALAEDVIHELLSPPEGYIQEASQPADIQFSWRTNLPLDNWLQVSSQSDFSQLHVNAAVSGGSQSVSLPAGNWYWRILATMGNQVFATAARQVRIGQPSQPSAAQTAPVPASPALAAAVQRSAQTAPDTVIQAPSESQQRLRSITFDWEAIPEASAYVFRLFEESSGGRRQIVQTEPITQNSWTLDDPGILNRSNYIWQVEALIAGSSTIVLEQSFSMGAAP